MAHLNRLADMIVSACQSKDWRTAKRLSEEFFARLIRFSPLFADDATLAIVERVDYYSQAIHFGASE